MLTLSCDRLFALVPINQLSSDFTRIDGTVFTGAPCTCAYAYDVSEAHLLGSVRCCPVERRSCRPPMAVGSNCVSGNLPIKRHLLAVVGAITELSCFFDPDNAVCALAFS